MWLGDKCVETNIDHDWFLKGYVIKAFKDQLAQHLGEQYVKHPWNWIEAFKDRWFPRWLKRKYPVVYKKYDVLRIFPNLLEKLPQPDQFEKEEWYCTFKESEDEL